MSATSDNTQFSLVPFDKQEWPPLLEPGFYAKTLAQVRVLCVDGFPLSKTRADIMLGLENLVAEFVSLSIPATFWIDGSFLTHKVDAHDVDMVIFVAADFYNSTNPQQKYLLDWINAYQSLEPGPDAVCDAYVAAYWQPGHQYYEIGAENRRYWINQFGFSRSREIKGMAVVTVP